MEKKTGYQIITYRFRLYCPHKEWLLETKKIYNLVLGFYYEILHKEPRLEGMESGQKLLRQLELLTVGARGQEKSEIKYPLPYEKVPLYFRRAAINDAVRLHRIWLAGKSRKKNTGDSTGAGRAAAGGNVNPAGKFQASPVFYKGMYKDFSGSSVCLKLWNGEKWLWTECGLDTCGRSLPEAGRLLSPVLKAGGKRDMLHVPVRKEVEDARSVRDRLQEEERVCAAFFPGNDCLAVLAVVGKSGDCEESLFIRGGRQLAHEKRLLLNRIRKNRDCMGRKPAGKAGPEGGAGSMKELPEDENRHLKEKIRNLTEDQAHKASRQIVEFCEKRSIRIIAVPRYRQGIRLDAMGYLKAGSCDWAGRRIMEYLRYKAFGKGIAVASVSPAGITGTCHACGEPVKRFNKNNRPGRNYYGGKNYICPGGHRGNANLNSALNVGRKFLKSQAETQG